jgi:lipoyl synthase
MRRLLREYQLNTVCEEARCPNIGECFSAKTSTVMILGDVCTRKCDFCAVATGRPREVDPNEPERLASIVGELGLRFVVITSVNRDDLEDGGASQFASCVREIRKKDSSIYVELLIPDFNGSLESLKIIAAADPDILGHNMETVVRLTPEMRHRAEFERSLGVLKNYKILMPERYTKSAVMVGLGETEEELLEVFRKLRSVECDFLSIGQYLQPTRNHHPVVRYWSEEEFASLREAAEDMGFIHVEAGPRVRSSYLAHKAIPLLKKRGTHNQGGEDSGL